MRLYEQYRQEQQEQIEKKNIGTSLGVSEDKVVVKKISTLSKVLEILEEILIKVLKALFYVLLMGLASIGTTTLINGQLRDIFIELLQTTFL